MIDQAATDALTCALITKPRVPLAQLPTPLEEAPHLSERLGARVLIKRDDLTGLALGGNKARKLEFLIGDAMISAHFYAIDLSGTASPGGSVYLVDPQPLRVASSFGEFVNEVLSDSRRLYHGEVERSRT